MLIQTSACIEKREALYGLAVKSSALRNTMQHWNRSSSMQSVGIGFGVVVLRHKPATYSLKPQVYSLLRVRGSDGQVTKGVRGMSWYQEAMKSVEVCEKLGGADKQVMIPRCSN
jgi:hypothetical protein